MIESELVVFGWVVIAGAADSDWVAVEGVVAVGAEVVAGWAWADLVVDDFFPPKESLLVILEIEEDILVENSSESVSRRSCFQSSTIDPTKTKMTRLPQILVVGGNGLLGKLNYFMIRERAEKHELQIQAIQSSNHLLITIQPSLSFLLLLRMWIINQSRNVAHTFLIYRICDL